MAVVTVGAASLREIVADERFASFVARFACAAQRRAARSSASRCTRSSIGFTGAYRRSGRTRRVDLSAGSVVPNTSGGYGAADVE